MDFDNSISNSILDSTITNNYEYGIEIDSATNTIISNNVFTNNHYDDERIL